MSDDVYGMLSAAKKENGDAIYFSQNVRGVYTLIEPKFRELFDALYLDAARGGEVEKFHTDRIAVYNKAYKTEPPERKVCDYIASMTDDYFVAAYEHFVGKKFGVEYNDYF